MDMAMVEISQPDKKYFWPELSPIYILAICSVNYVGSPPKLGLDPKKLGLTCPIRC
jgi:hypothetical protein